MQELEILLASLCKRGRKPKNREIISIRFDQEFTKSEGRIILRCNCKDWPWFYADLRWLVNLDSWLWQFVCENNLYKKEANNFRENVSKVWNNIWWFSHNYQYRLLESALVPKEELEQFLLDNIKIEWMMN